MDKTVPMHYKTLIMHLKSFKSSIKCISKSTTIKMLKNAQWIVFKWIKFIKIQEIIVLLLYWHEIF